MRDSSPAPGYCHCGCGELAPLRPYTIAKKGVKKGDPYDYINGHYGRSPEPIIDERIDKSWEAGHDSPCWKWLGYVGNMGYGQIGIHRISYLVHRVVYERERGPVPEGLELDHLCRNPRCCNPEHLEPVTHRENSRRALLKLTEATLAQIWKFKKTGQFSNRAIGRMMGLTHSSVGRALRELPEVSS